MWKASFARVLVEVNAEKGLVDEVDVCYKSLGKSMKLKVEYPWKPPVCSTCKVFGHELEKCKLMVKGIIKRWRFKVTSRIRRILLIEKNMIGKLKIKRW